MDHLSDALSRIQTEIGSTPFITLDANAHKISFVIQEGPIKEAGVNGLQATDILLFTKHLFHSLNTAHPCRENSLTITKIEEAILWQHARTLDRERRGVEGANIS